MASAFQRRNALEEQHKTVKDRMKDEMGEAEGEISKLVTIVVDKAEDRKVRVEIRPDLRLGLCEEWRLDTGEFMRTRDMSRDDKARAERMAQTRLPLDEVTGQAPDPDHPHEPPTH